MRSISRAFVAVALASIFSTSATAATLAQICEFSKNKAVGKTAICFTNAAAKLARGGSGSGFGSCLLKLTTAFTKAEAKAAGQCPTNNDLDAVYYRVDHCVGGQSGIYASLSAGPRFVDNGDGTVSDKATGLVWEKKANSDGAANLSDPHDADNLYSWNATGTNANGTAYTDFLAKLNDNGGGCFANQCDWRLPTFVELQEITDLNAVGCNSGSPCIDPVFGPTKPAIHWSNTSVLESTGVLIVDFNDGKASEIFMGGTNFVRAVRADRL